MKDRIIEDMKAAMKAADKRRLSTIRLILAAIKQKEIDTREELDETGILQILNRLAKQGRESIEQYGKAGREDLRDKEQAELDIICSYLPEALGADAVEALIAAAISELQASDIKDMGKVMKALKAKMQGRTDMSEVSKKVRAALSK